MHVHENGRDLIPLALKYSLDWDPTASSPCTDGEHGHKDATGYSSLETVDGNSEDKTKTFIRNHKFKPVVAIQNVILGIFSSGIDFYIRVHVTSEEHSVVFS